MAFFRKADAKVRQIFEPPKLFEVFLKIYFSMMEVRFLINASVFHYYRVSLSKAGAKLLLYNISAKCLHPLFSNFLQTFC